MSQHHQAYKSHCFADGCFLEDTIAIVNQLPMNSMSPNIMPAIVHASTKPPRNQEFE